ncbi:MAG TPA: hypothetical protein DD632_06990 [Oribacterium sp.]|nr:hypothetical protein [Oribacterium sp.]
MQRPGIRQGHKSTGATDGFLYSRNGIPRFYIEPVCRCTQRKHRFKSFYQHRKMTDAERNRKITEEEK